MGHFKSLNVQRVFYKRNYLAVVTMVTKIITNFAVLRNNNVTEVFVILHISTFFFRWAHTITLFGGQSSHRGEVWNTKKKQNQTPHPQKKQTWYLINLSSGWICTVISERSGQHENQYGLKNWLPTAQIVSWKYFWKRYRHEIVPIRSGRVQIQPNK